MAIQNVNVSLPNDGLGDKLRNSFIITNANDNELQANKVDKVPGQGLSDRNYTQAEKDKLAAVVVPMVATAVGAVPHATYLIGNTVQQQLDNTENTFLDAQKVLKIDWKNLYQTGISRTDNDDTIVVTSATDTILINSVDNILFINEVAPDVTSNKLANFVFNFSDLIFVTNATNTPLSANTRGIFYLGVDKTGLQVYRTSRVYDQDTCYLARILVQNTAGVYSIINYKYYPDLANNNPIDKGRKVRTAGYLKPSGNGSISFGTVGISLEKDSVNYSNNHFDPNLLVVPDTTGTTATSFVFLVPNVINIATPLTTAFVINPTQWYNAAGTVGAGAVGNNSYQVYRVLISVQGIIQIQTKASTSNAPAPGINAIFATREDALAGLTSVVFPDLAPAGDTIPIGTFYLRAGTAVNGSGMSDPNDFYFLAITQSSSSSTVGVTQHDLLSGKNANPTFQHVTTTDIGNWNTKVNGSGTFQYIPKWGGTSTLQDSQMFESGGDINVVNSLRVAGTKSYFENGNIYLDNFRINCGFNANATAGLLINYQGFNNGGTQFRNTQIGNGKQSIIATFDGATSSLNLGTTTPLVGAKLTVVPAQNQEGIAINVPTAVGTAPDAIYITTNGTDASNSLVTGAAIIMNGTYNAGIIAVAEETSNGSVGFRFWRKSGTPTTNRAFEIYDSPQAKTTYRVDQLGNVLAQSYVKDGGTAAQFLMADGSVTTAGGGGGSIGGSGAANYVSRWISPSTLATGVLYDNAINVGVSTTNPTAYSHGGTNRLIEILNENTTANAQSHLILSTNSILANSSLGSLTWAMPNISHATKFGGYIGMVTNATHTSTNPATDIVFANRDGSIGDAKEVMRMKSNGDVGIGTIPTAIVGYRIFAIGGSGGALINLNSTQIVADTARTYINEPRDTSIGFLTNGLDRVTILGNGNVGIGTTTPNRRLEVVSADAEQIVLRSTSASNLSGIFFNPANTTYSSFIGGTANDIVFYTNGTERARITAGSNVGIGTPNPQYKLHVSGEGFFEGQLVTRNPIPSNGVNDAISYSPIACGSLSVDQSDTAFYPMITGFNQISGVGYTNQPSFGWMRYTGGDYGGTGAAVIQISGDGTPIKRWSFRASGDFISPNSILAGANVFAQHVVLNASNGGNQTMQYSGINDWVFGENSGDETRNFNFYNYNRTIVEMSINRDTGNVGIGNSTTPAAQKLFVGGNIMSSTGFGGGFLLEDGFSITRQNGYAQIAHAGVGVLHISNGFLNILGSANVNGTVTASSDIRLKTNIEPLENSLDKVLKLKGVKFDRIDSDEKNQIGFIAQELEEVFPQLVKTEKTEEAYKSVNYQAMVAVLVEAIKEQQAQIDELKNEITQLKNK